VAVVLVACAVVAALTLLGPHQPTYDPWAWLLWGREIVHGHLETVAGPSWKPLPVLLTTPFAVLGGAAPQLWLVVARTGFLVGVIAAYWLARSVAGPVAGALAALGVLAVDRFTALSVRGDSEGILTALALGAVVLHRAGRRRDAVLAGLAACLVRPEVWPFVGAYVLWLVVRDVDAARRRRVVFALAVGGLVVLAAWFVPERLGSGSLLRGAARARLPVAGSPAQAAHPFLAVFGNSASAVAIPLYVGAVLAAVCSALAWWRGRAQARDHGLVLLLAGASSVYMVIVGVLAQAGFTGNERYVLLPASVVCILGGIGLVWLARRAAAPGAARVALVLGIAGGLALGIGPARRLGRQLESAQDESQLYDHLADAIDHAGGPAAIRRCGHLYTDPFQTQPLLWQLRLTGGAIGIRPAAPGTVIAPAGTAVARTTRGFGFDASSAGWVVRSSCAFPTGR
jgi:hypothetical protein